MEAPVVEKREEIALTTAYCVKCRGQREVMNPEETMMKNRKMAITGVCPICGTKLFRISGPTNPATADQQQGLPPMRAQASRR